MDQWKIKTILYLYPTKARAQQAFKEFVDHNDPNGVTLSYRYSNLTVEGDGIIRKFTTPEMNIQGLEIHSVWVDECVEMSEEQKAMMRSRMRGSK